ncbi:SDR family oxidoreductase [Conexibacter woesei]|uniref:SDR family oxidoreductase n=1 Tax=Conexibacter woesei TaxID=191495 RepID=UPI000416CDFC|nr:SDR family oxidoreductase [Conexibacter woesei]
MILTNKVAVIYGAGGAIGGAIARELAAEGARVFLTGRRAEPVEAVAAAIGPAAEAAVVDALDEPAILAHLDGVVATAGRVDISFNAIGMAVEEILGDPLLDTDAARYALPLATYPTSFFLTARGAARHMVANGAGAILTVSALPGRVGSPLNGGYGPAQAAKEAMIRDLSLELAPRGLRVLGLRPHGLPETATMRDIYELKAAAMGIDWEAFQTYLANASHPHRAMRLDEVARTAAFLASDGASGITGTTVNLTMGNPD